MKAIILAAGRGSRMSGLTTEKPKCLVEIAGRPLLSWQLSALSGAGIADIAVVCGYRAEMVEKLKDSLPVPFKTLRNPEWETTNMLATLTRALDWVGDKECVVSYSDIVYPVEHVLALMRDSSPLAITYDTLWEELWRLRQEGDPLADAETFREVDGRLLEIGAKPETLDQVQGQYMGLIKIAPEGWRLFKAACRELGEDVGRIDMTGFLGRLLAGGVFIGAVRVDGRWCEVDTDRDLELYSAELAKGKWMHDWRSDREEKGDR